MNTATINISLPKSMYTDAQKTVLDRRYSSISELIRDALRNLLYGSNLTPNGFTPEFEQEVLRRSKNQNDFIDWDNKGSFTDFVLKNKAINKSD